MFPAYLRNDELSVRTPTDLLQRTPQPLRCSPALPRTPWSLTWKTFSTTSSPRSTIPPTAKPTPALCAWSGRASLSPAGPTATPVARQRRLPNQPPAAGSWPSCSTPDTPSSRHHRGRPASRGRRNCRTSHHRRPQHGRRRLRPNRRLGPLRLRRRSHARPGPHRPARLHAGGTRRLGRRHAPILGETTYDIYLNARAYWRNVPAGVWTYKLGGYQVLKKWLSYRERTILRRPLKPDEVQHFAETARRIAAILLETHRKM